jgi:hypothetical protein
MVLAMNAKFDERVETAINNIWFKMDISALDKSLQMLRDAANMGDGDAYYFLGRCYLGSAFVDPSLNLPLDIKFAHECFDMSILFESSVGMFGTMHIDGYTPHISIPKRKIWNDVARRAYSGNVFCKFLLANAYYYGYIAEFKGGEVSQYEWNAGALNLYEECVDAGLGIAIPNLVDLLISGKNGERLQLKTAEKYVRLGADMGIGMYERMVGNYYRKSGNGEMALKMYESALSHRDFYTYYCLGRLYTYNGLMGQDLDKALFYFGKGYELFPDDYGLCNRLGEIYFYSKKDYDMAFYYLNKARELGSSWGYDMLGTCYLYGLGTAVDVQMARQLFGDCPKKRLAISGLGKLASH